MFKCTKSSKSKATGSKGGLTLASSSVRKVCEETEKCFARLMAATSGRLPHGQGVPDSISITVLGSLAKH